MCQAMCSGFSHELQCVEKEKKPWQNTDVWCITYFERLL